MPLRHSLTWFWGCLSGIWLTHMQGYQASTCSPCDPEPRPFNHPFDEKNENMPSFNPQCLSAQYLSCGNQVPNLIKCWAALPQISERIHHSCSTIRPLFLSLAYGNTTEADHTWNEHERMAVVARKRQYLTSSKTNTKRGGTWESLWNTYRNPSRCYRARRSYIGIIPSDIRTTFHSLLLPPLSLAESRWIAITKIALFWPTVVVSNPE